MMHDQTGRKPGETSSHRCTAKLNRKFCEHPTTCAWVQGTQDFTLTLANVEWVSEADSFLFLRCNTNLTIKGPLILDAEPFRLSQCRVSCSDGETYLDLQVTVTFCIDRHHLDQLQGLLFKRVRR